MKKQTLLLSLIWIIVFLFILFHKINTIECIINNQPCDTNLINQLLVLKGKSFFFTDFNEELAKLEKNNSIYILQSVNKNIPGKVILEIKREDVKYELEVNKEVFYFGNSGISIPKQENYVVQKIFWQNNELIFENNIINPNYHSLFLTISEELNKQNIQKNKNIFWISDEEIILEIESEPNFIFDKETIETGIKKIGTILEAREIDEIQTSIKEVDMRFELPVLRTDQ